MKITNIKTEYLSNPLGIDSTHPMITWNIVGDDVKFQKAFEIIYKISNGEEIKIQIIFGNFVQCIAQ